MATTKPQFILEKFTSGIHPSQIARDYHFHCRKVYQAILKYGAVSPYNKDPITVDIVDSILSDYLSWVSSGNDVYFLLGDKYKISPSIITEIVKYHISNVKIKENPKALKILIKKMIGENLSRSAIASMLNITVKQTYLVLPKSKKIATYKRYNAIIRHYKANPHLTLGKLAEETGNSIASVRYAIKRKTDNSRTPAKNTEMGKYAIKLHKSGHDIAHIAKATLKPETWVQSVLSSV